MQFAVVEITVPRKPTKNPVITKEIVEILPDDGGERLGIIARYYLRLLMKEGLIKRP